MFLVEPIETIYRMHHVIRERTLVLSPSWIPQSLSGNMLMVIAHWTAHLSQRVKLFEDDLSGVAFGPILDDRLKEKILKP